MILHRSESGLPSCSIFIPSCWYASNEAISPSKYSALPGGSQYFRPPIVNPGLKRIWVGELNVPLIQELLSIIYRHSVKWLPAVYSRHKVVQRLELCWIISSNFPHFMIISKDVHRISEYSCCTSWKVDTITCSASDFYPYLWTLDTVCLTFTCEKTEWNVIEC